MQYLLELPDKKLKIYYNKKVYSPEYSAVDTILVADKAIQGAAIRVLDVGCGSGVVGLGIKALNPQIKLFASDIDSEAVRITRLNGKRLGLEVETFKEDLAPGGWDMIVANLPTYDQEQMDKFELHGPESAYFGEGATLYGELFEQAKCKVLVCECQAKHQKEFLELAEALGWELILSTEMAFAFIQATSK